MSYKDENLCPEWTDPSSRIDRNFIIQWFSPRWYIFIMGTGALANIYSLLSREKSGMLNSIAILFFLIAFAAFPIATFFKIKRLIYAFDYIRREWSHSSLIQFYSAIPISAAIIATGFSNIQIPLLSQSWQTGFAILFWGISVLLSLAFIFAIPFRIIVGDHAEPHRALGFWFLPPVGLFVMVFSGNFIALKGSVASFNYAVFCLNTLVLGIAIFMTIAIFSIFLFRVFFYKFPRPDVAPSYMIGVAPIGVAIIAMNTYVSLLVKLKIHQFPPIEILNPFINLLSILLWGFGFWWLLLALMITIRSFIKYGIPVTLGYWAFIFPPAAFTIATLIVSRKLHFEFLWTVGQGLSVLLLASWICISGLVIRYTINRKIFELPESFNEILD